MHTLCSWLVFVQISSQPLPQPYSSIQKAVSSSSDNPRRLWQTINKLLYRNSSYLPTLQPVLSLIALLLSSLTKYLNFVCLWPVVLLHHRLRIHILLRKHPLTSPLLSLLLNLIQLSQQTMRFWALVTFTTLSKNLSYHLSSKNLLWTNMNSLTTAQFPTSHLYQKW